MEALKNIGSAETGMGALKNTGSAETCMGALKSKAVLRHAWEP